MEAQSEPVLPDIATTYFKLRDSDLPYSAGGYEDQYFLFQLEMEACQSAEEAVTQRIQQNKILAGKPKHAD